MHLKYLTPVLLECSRVKLLVVLQWCSLSYERKTSNIKIKKLKQCIKSFPSANQIINGLKYREKIPIHQKCINLYME